MGSRNQSRVRNSGFGQLRLEALEDREVPAAIGTLDPTFGVGGKVTLPAEFSNLGGQVATVDPTSGRTVIVGNDSAGYFVALRLNADGTTDRSFGNDGVARFRFNGYDAPAGVVVDAAGSIFIGGTAGFSGSDTAEMVVVKLSSTGSLDGSFGTGGAMVIAAPTGYTDLYGAGLALGPGNTIVVVSKAVLSAGGSNAMVARLRSDGSFDPTFHGGTVQLFGNGHSVPSSMTIDSLGRIVVAGNDLGGAYQVTRLTANGDLDLTFAGTGTVQGAAGSPFHAYRGVATDQDGNVYLSGYVVSAGDPHRGNLAVMKLTSLGVADAAFGSGGVFTSPIQSGLVLNGTVGGITVLSDGAILAVGVAGDSMDSGATVPANARYALYKVTSTGALDTRFNPSGPTPGALVLSIGSDDVAQPVGLGVTSTGQVIVAGFNFANGNAEAFRVTGAGASQTGLGSLLNPFANLGVEVRMTEADVNGDGILDTIFATGPGVAFQIAVVNGADNTLLLGPFAPFGTGFTGGGFVAAGDLDRDGHADIVVTPDVGGGPRVRIYSLADGAAELRADFFAFDPAFRGGARVAVGDVNGDGAPDLVVAAGVGGGPRVAIFDGKTVETATPLRLVSDFFAFAPAFTGGVNVAVGDVNGDGRADIIVGAGRNGGPVVTVFDGRTGQRLSNFFAFDTGFTGGVNVAAVDLDGDGRAEVVAAPGVGGGPVVKAYGMNATGAVALKSQASVYTPSFRGGLVVAGRAVSRSIAVGPALGSEAGAELFGPDLAPPASA